MPRPAREALRRPRRGLRTRRRRWRRSGVTGLVVRSRFRPDYSAHNAPGERVAVGVWQGVCRTQGSGGGASCLFAASWAWSGGENPGKGLLALGNCGTEVKRRGRRGFLAIGTKLPTLTLPTYPPPHLVPRTVPFVVTRNQCLSDFDITFESFTRHLSDLIN